MRTASVSSLLAITTVLLAGLACQPAAQQRADQQPTAADSAALRSAVSELHAAFKRAVEENQYQGDLGYASDAVFYPPMLPPITGVDSIRASVRQYYSGRDVTVEIETQELQRLAPNWAYEIGTTTVSFTPEGADEPTTSEYTYFAILRRTDDGWRYYREATNLNHPPPAAAEE